MKNDPYSPCLCNSGKKQKFCHPKGYFFQGQYSEIEADFELGEKLMKEFDEENKERKE